MNIERVANGFDIRFELTEDSTFEQAGVLLRALEVYADRNGRYKDNWRRKGWRGALFQLRNCTERAWDALWNAEPGQTVQRDKTPHDDDDLIDAINYAAQTVRLVWDGDRDGTWRYG